jgi:DNA-binding beta-propeller fold protein YncE
MKKMTLFLFVSLPMVFACGDDGEVVEIPEEGLGKLYVTAVQNGVVAVIDPLNPGDATTLYDHTNDGLNSVMGIAMDYSAQMIYSTEMDENRIVRMKADGTGDVEVVYDSDDGVNRPQGIAVDPISGNLYWANEETGQLMLGSMDGTEEPHEIYEGEDFGYECFGMWIDHENGLLYYGDQNWARIYAGNLDGTGKPVLIVPTLDGFLCTSAVQVVDDKIYWTDYCVDRIMVASLTGPLNVTTLYDLNDGVDGPFGLYVDKENDRIYWSETVDNVIAYGNLAGTAEPVVIDELINSWGIVLDKFNP